MRSVVILTDHLGYKLRCDALKAAHPEVYVVTPDDKPHRHAVSFKPREDWLPTDPTMPYRMKCWWSADKTGFSAARHLGVRADFVWFIESDVVATQDRWKAMFADFENDPSDLVAPMIRRRNPKSDNYLRSLAPEWATHHCLMAVFRLSRRALNECVRCAGEMRDCFSEVSIPSVVHRAGMTMTGLNVRQTHTNAQTFGVREEDLIKNPNLLVHPDKRNSFGP